MSVSSYIYGPVPSRRLGRSLGVDLVPFKTCTYDCIYCQLGRTTCKTIQRKEWVPLEHILAGLERKLASRPDYITLSGSGEPTLHAGTGELIDRIKAMTDVPVAVLTNGSLLWREEVRAELANADLVIPSLDAGDEGRFRAVNRPHREITFERMLGGLADFRREFKGQYWLEVFLLAGYTAIDADLAKLAGCVERIGPDRVQLNTATRPTAEEFAVGVTRERMSQVSSMFRPPAEVIAEFRNEHGHAEFSAGRDDILDLLRRRPSSLDDVAGGLGMHRNEVIKHLEQLRAENLVETTWAAGQEYYRPVR